ncbi:MAG: O-acetyl-ADP-ribose deacetylase [Candidatus Omnitrophica bacterium ADurb.Bin292]|nr:MAG: O-acetyl-ADP-ribose deacetylase [Candidatus Omnitrophica bacterium ADurb.Bin292]HPW76426.1 macro domain-containing protein [Candidatus Omnitrophota bacterium]HQB12194.1 macro domain-containing protein [Candidatus Omnitrophota bacterium]
MITIKQGDITKESVDVIVNAANTGLKGGGGVDGAIHRAAGPQVMVECRAIGHCPTGTAVITGAGNLLAKKIIHTAGPVWNGGSRREPELLRDCYVGSFRLAKAHGLRTIAFPAISTGVYGYPKREAATIALNVGIQFEKKFNEIRYLCFTTEDLQIYQDTYATLRKQPGADHTCNG